MASGRQVPRQAKGAERRSGRRRAAGEGSIYGAAGGASASTSGVQLKPRCCTSCANCSAKRRPVSCTGTRPRRAVAPVLAGTCRQRRPARLSRTRGDQFEARLKALLIAPKHRLLRL